MPRREYDGPAIGGTWKSGPWAGDGETVAVVDDRSRPVTTPGDLESVVEMLVDSGVVPLTDGQMKLLTILDDAYPDGKTTPELAESFGKRKSLITQKVNNLPDELIVTAGKQGATRTRFLTYPLDTIRRGVAATSDYDLPEDVDPLRTTGTQREILGLKTVYPSLSHRKLASRVGVVPRTVTNTLDKFGFEWDKQEQDESPPGKINLNHAPETMERAWRLKQELDVTWSELLELLIDNHENQADAVTDGGRE